VRVANGLRILLITNLFPPDARGGAEWVAHDLAHSLSERGHEIRVLTRQAETGEAFRETPGSVEVRRTLRFHGAPSRTPLPRLHHLVTEEYYDRANAEMVRREIRSFHPDLVYLNAPTGLSHAPLWVAAQARSPLLIHLHDYWLRDAFAHRRLGALNRILWQVLTRKHYRIVAVSTRLKDLHIESGMPVNGFTVIRNALPPSRIARGGGNLIQEPRAVYCGRITRAKGLHIAAMARIPVTVFGRGDESYLAECAELGGGRIEFAGCVPRDEVPAILARYPILVLPSLWEEPCPLSILEAMAAGCVPVASRIGGIPELIHPRGSEPRGVLVPPADAPALEDAVRRLLSDDGLRARLARLGRDAIETRFRWDRFLDEVEAVCASLTG
jgi:glycosyltransferase involved in cell wall biosynthesis